MNYLRDLCCMHTPERVVRHGCLDQRHARALETAARLHVVEVGRWFAEQGWTQLDTARFLDLSPRTLRYWQFDLAPNRLLSRFLGRPALRSPRDQRNEVIHFLDEQGPATPLAGLRDAFPGMVRAELHDLLGRYRRVWRQRHRQPLRVLHWTLPGSVWAMDFAEPPLPIDGRYPYLLAVRDLASGQQLLWQPVAAANAAAVVAALAPLFVIHGAPLVLKSDNGSPFSADATQALLHEFEVIPLFSPPGMPAYNGSVEAGIGSLKTRSDYHAACHGRFGFWACDDVAAARLEANATAQPQGPTGPTPDQAWAARRRLTAGDRALLQAAATRQQPGARADQGQPEVGPLTERSQRAIDRIAIRRALEEHGYLLYSRRRIPLPIPKRKAARIT